MDFSYQDGDNFTRNSVTVKCTGGAPFAPPARKVSVSDGLPVDLDAIMLDLRVDSDDERDTVQRMARGAAAFLERRTGFVLIPGTYQVDMPGWWPEGVEFNRGPLRGDPVLRYLAGRDDWQDVDAAQVFTMTTGRTFTTKFLSTFTRPALWSEAPLVRLEFEAGYAVDGESGSDDGPPIDDGLRTCFLMLVAHYYQNRELFAAAKFESIETGARDLLGAYRQFW